MLTLTSVPFCKLTELESFSKFVVSREEEKVIFLYYAVNVCKTFRGSPRNIFWSLTKASSLYLRNFFILAVNIADTPFVAKKGPIGDSS